MCWQEQSQHLWKRLYLRCDSINSNHDNRSYTELHDNYSSHTHTASHLNHMSLLHFCKYPTISSLLRSATSITTYSLGCQGNIVSIRLQWLFSSYWQFYGAAIVCTVAFFQPFSRVGVIYPSGKERRVMSWIMHRLYILSFFLSFFLEVMERTISA